MDSSMWVIGEAIARVAAGGAAGWGEAATRRAYRTADGKLITISAAEPRTWSAFCTGIDRPDLEPLLYAHPSGQEGLTAELETIFATRTAGEWVALLGDSAAAVGPVLTVEDILGDAHVTARGSVVEIDGGNGAPVRALRNPVHYVDVDGREIPFAPSPPPELGADTDAALGAAGFDADEIATLRRDGAV
jgi:crotonobetainyl-CoA:carnitine CoA-transferase CaiB-like acyl-CoA transferase